MYPQDTPFSELLFKFSESFGSQIERHTRHPLTDKHMRALDRFPDKGSSSGECRQLVALMGKNGKAIEYLTSRLKEKGGIHCRIPRQRQPMTGKAENQIKTDGR